MQLTVDLGEKHVKRLWQMTGEIANAYIAVPLIALYLLVSIERKTRHTIKSDMKYIYLSTYILVHHIGAKVGHS